MAVRQVDGATFIHLPEGREIGLARTNLDAHLKGTGDLGRHVFGLLSTLYDTHSRRHKQTSNVL